ncbi:flagellar hook-length control protein FliK [Paenibacillus alkalitolerans]|uniref:flagellar hook-length control protein FliK n=1 Tax=Paenibacillus alkalitolerans TaxID=2799335 RepID=UPI0018F4FA4B|nr:flagellar hook-length control protein FliK [Paenibacillus alkalitolerans]
MNPMMITANATIGNMTATSVNSALASASAANGQRASATDSQLPAFASLLLGLFSGSASDTAKTTELPLTLHANPAADSISSAAEAEGEEGETAEEMLSQLLQLLEAMPAEWKQSFESWVPARQWISAAKAELAIATGDVIVPAQPALTGQPLSEGESAAGGTNDEFRSLLTRLSEVLSKESGNAPLLRTAAEAKQAVKQFISAMKTAPNEQAAVHDETVPLRNGAAQRLVDGSAAHVISRSGITAMLTQLNGKLSGASESGVSVAAANPNPHLAAMDSKFAAVRLSVIHEPSQIVSPEPVTSTESKPPTEGTSLFPAAAESSKGASSEALQRSDASPRRMNAAAFSDEMTEWIMRQTAGGRTGSVTEAKISLFPEHLGQVEVKLTVHNGQLTALFTAESPMAKDMLEVNLATLRSNLQNQGVHVEKLEVSQQAALGSGMFQDGKQRRPAERDSRQTKQRDGEGIEERTDSSLRLDESEHSRIRTYGSSFHATA